MSKEETEKPAEEITAETKDENFTSVESSAFTGFHYHAEANTIEIKFPDGDVYKYGDAENPYTAELHEKFLAAKSKGSFLNNHIKKLPFTDLTVRAAKVEKPEEENASIEPANGVFNSDEISEARAEIAEMDKKIQGSELPEGEKILAADDVKLANFALDKMEEFNVSNAQKQIEEIGQAAFESEVNVPFPREITIEFTDDGFAKLPGFDKVQLVDELNEKAEKLKEHHLATIANNGQLLKDLSNEDISSIENKMQIGLCELEPGNIQRYCITLRADGSHTEELI